MITVALVLTVLGACGPIGGDDASPTPTHVLLPATSPVVRPLPTIAATPISSPQVASLASPIATPIASPGTAAQRSASPVLPSPTVRPRPKPTKTPRPKRLPTGTPAPPVAADCVAPENPPSPDQTEPVTVNADGVNLRSAPGTTCDIIQVVSAGTTAMPKSGPVEADHRLWILVDVSGTQGWVAVDFVD